MTAGWRECADPVELAAAVAAGVEVRWNNPGWPGAWGQSTASSEASFAAAMRGGNRYRVPASWSWSPEPPAPDDLVSRARRHAETHPESRELIEELLEELLEAVVRWACFAAPPPVPSWPDGVLRDAANRLRWIANSGYIEDPGIKRIIRSWADELDATLVPPWPLEDDGVLYAVRSDTVTLREPSTGRQFRVGFEVSESGIRVVEVAMTAGPSESITARKIQAARLGEIIRLSLMTVAMPLDPDTSQWRPGMAGDWPTEQMERSWSSEGRGRGRPQSVTVDEYEQAANEYRAAQAEGRPTTRAVADALGVSESTARKRIMAARGRGLLPPADTTRPRL